MSWVSEKHIKNLVNSYHILTKKRLVPKDLPEAELYDYLNQANFAVLSHGVEPDPILNYGNRLALQLWEMTPEQWVLTPSRLTAEAPLREIRERFLQEVHRKGYIEDYTGIRISKSGKRFMIKQATVWNISNESGLKIGQAAMFQDWEPIPD